MITYWQQEDGKFQHHTSDDLTAGKNTWVDARNVNREDIRILEQEYHIDQEHILDILDQDELSRIEKNDDYILIIVRLPLFVPENDISYLTVPLGIVVFPDVLITICWTDCEVLKDISSNRIKGISLSDFPAFLMRVLARSDSLFLRYLKEINRRSTTIQNELQQSVKNADLMHLLNLEKSLLFFATSLKSNKSLIDRLGKTKLLPLDDDDRDWLEDVTIDHRQAIEMTDTYSEIISSVTDSFASIISNNLNVVMKRLTVISLVLMVPTFITGFFGMNVPLPFANIGPVGTVIVSGLCLFSALFAQLLLKDKPVVSGRRQKKPRKPKALKENRKRHIAAD